VFCTNFKKVIEERTKYLQSSTLTTDSKSEKDADEFETKKQLAFIDLLLRAETEDGHLMSRKDIRDEVSTFMFEVS
jgi:cytochrome P450